MVCRSVKFQCDVNEIEEDYTENIKSDIMMMLTVAAIRSLPVVRINQQESEENQSRWRL